VAAAAILACRPQLFHVVVPGDQEFDERYAGRRHLCRCAAKINVLFLKFKH